MDNQNSTVLLRILTEVLDTRRDTANTKDKVTELSMKFDQVTELLRQVLDRHPEEDDGTPAPPINNIAKPGRGVSGETAIKSHLATTWQEGALGRTPEDRYNLLSDLARRMTDDINPASFKNGIAGAVPEYGPVDDPPSPIRHTPPPEEPEVQIIYSTAPSVQKSRKKVSRQKAPVKPIAPRGTPIPSGPPPVLQTSKKRKFSHRNDTSSGANALQTTSKRKVTLPFPPLLTICNEISGVSSSFLSLSSAASLVYKLLWPA
ncbi:hypothetical protein [Absidia glauca]|uniref:Uncharacterized protein n=1 Tax=Absidia glauca TaxID=4829 RepID=A0A168M2Z6_ABSGL|nr:hypothetical protein [Absidia glauca]